MSHCAPFESLEPRALLSAGDLDVSFARRGFVISDRFGTATDVEVQADGKVLVTTTSHLLRFTADGRLDRSFALGGKVRPGFRIAGVELDGAGRIVVGGDSSRGWGVARYRADGTPDPTFNSTGRLITHAAHDSGEDATAVTLQPDGKILIGGTQTVEPGNPFGKDRSVVRFNANGSLDTSFGENGQALAAESQGTSNHALLVRPNGDIVAAGLERAGGLSSLGGVVAFDGSGDVIANATASDWTGGFSTFSALAVQSDGTLAILEEGMGTSAVFLTDDYTLTTAERRAVRFAHHRTGAWVTATTLGVAPDDKLLVAGESRLGLGLQRLNPDGSLDRSFGDASHMTLAIPTRASRSITAVAVAPDGDILIVGGGGERMFLARVQGGSNAPRQQPPRAEPSASSFNVPSKWPRALVYVHYADDRALDLSTLGDGDLLVKGPGGLSRLATRVEILEHTDDSVEVSYAVIRPGGWRPRHEGVYTLILRAGQVEDDAGNAAPGGVIGKVRIQVI